MNKVTLRRLLAIVASSGHTSLTVDEVAVDHELREVFGVGLNDEIVLRTTEEERNLINGLHHLEQAHAFLEKS